MVIRCNFLTLLTTLVSCMMVMAQCQPRVLVYTATKGYRHDSIPTAIDVLRDQQSSWNVTFEFTEDEGMFRDDTLRGFDGVMFVSNSEEVLDSTGKEALSTFFRSGGVYTGVHSASACLFNDLTYQNVVGALFDYHPELQTATFERLNTTHPATSNLPDRWTFEEEVYMFRSDPRSAGAVVLLTVDESSYTNNGTSTGNYPSQGDPHPIAWYIESPQSAQPLLQGASKAGRSFYTSLGHLNSTWQDETFINHVMSGLTWALEGGSTKAYGQGLVGSSNSSTGGGASTSSGPSASGSGAGAGASASGSSGTASSGAASGASSSGAAMSAKGLSGGLAGGATLALGAVVAGVALVL